MVDGRQLWERLGAGRSEAGAGPAARVLVALRSAVLNHLPPSEATAILHRAGLSQGRAWGRLAALEVDPTHREEVARIGKLFIEAIGWSSSRTERARGDDRTLAAWRWPSCVEIDDPLPHPRDQSGCWLGVGLISGFLTEVCGVPVRGREVSCRSRGADVCCIEARLADSTSDLDDEPVAASPAMKRVMSLVDAAARSDAGVLITGENGVGKARLARLIHRRSRRRGHAFVVVSCDALPERLLERELFGPTPPSPASNRGGRLVEASGGTLFVDQIDELPLRLQVRLLASMDPDPDQEEAHPPAPRIIASRTGARTDISSFGQSREDLFLRRRMISIHVPPLRSRPEDVLPLAQEILHQICERVPERSGRLGDEAERALVQHRWEGNVRELETRLERALVLCDGGVIGPEDLDLPRPIPPRGAVPRGGAAAPGEEATDTLADVERRHILRVLEAEDGHRRRAAARLGIGEATLYRKLKSYSST